MMVWILVWLLMFSRECIDNASDLSEVSAMHSRDLTLNSHN